jgi:hypothetical protein
MSDTRVHGSLLLGDDDGIAGGPARPIPVSRRAIEHESKTVASGKRTRIGAKFSAGSEA